MSSRGLIYELKDDNSKYSQTSQIQILHSSTCVLYAEKNNGTFVYESNNFSLNSMFICQRLHVFNLSEIDLDVGKWCSQCHRIPKKRRKSSFNVNYNSQKGVIDINCESGHAYQFNLVELKDFRICPRCTSDKKGFTSEVEGAKKVVDDAEMQFKIYENMFIGAYRRLLEAFPLIRKVSTAGLVATYFSSELYKLPEDYQPSCMAVHLILENKGFVKAIFDKLNEQLTKKFFHKIVIGISPAFTLEPRTLEAYEYLYSLTR